MTVQNLAVVFGPNILRPRDDSPDSISYGDSSTVCAVTELLIEKQALIFPIVIPPQRKPPAEPQQNRTSGGFVPGKSPHKRSNNSHSLLNNNRRSQQLPVLSHGATTGDLPTTGERKVFLSSFQRTTPSTSNIEQKPKNTPELSLEYLHDLLMKEKDARVELEERLGKLEKKLEQLS